MSHLRVVISCVSFETVKITQPILDYRADRVYLIHSGKKPPYIDFFNAVTGVLKKKKIKVLMVGDGPDRFKAEEQCRQAKICDRVLFLGKQENIKDLLAITDVAILPSGSESFGLVALESMAYGIPVVTTNTGGLPEVNIDGETGYTVDVGDIDGFADAVLKIINNRDLAAELGQNAARISRDRFAAEKIIPQYINYYRKILGG